MSATQTFAIYDQLLAIGGASLVHMDLKHGLAGRTSVDSCSAGLKTERLDVRFARLAVWAPSSFGLWGFGGEGCSIH